MFDGTMQVLCLVGLDLIYTKMNDDETMNISLLRKIERNFLDYDQINFDPTSQDDLQI